jgi:4-diphosphocytidyl-2-C-methyl-D-erythritol kinase
VPAALRPGPALVTGAGEKLRSLPALEPHGVLVLPTAPGLSTGEVFDLADELGLVRTPDELSSLRGEAERAFAQPGRPLTPLMVNDLEPAAVALCPAIPDALAAARGAGADHAIVTGSGPTVVGWFGGPEGPDRAEAAAAGLRPRFPGACAAVPVDAGFAAVRPSGTPR